ncbi:MAG TPA: hypothetical protein VF691_03295 [Cytophagaceae bacterium]
MLNFLLVFFFVFIQITHVLAQHPADTSTNHFLLANKLRALKFYKNTPEDTSTTKYRRWGGIQFSGYVRFYLQYRNLKEAYQDIPVAPSVAPGAAPPIGPYKNLFINGYEIFQKQAAGYQEPLVFLRAEGRPTSKTYFKVEYAFDHQMSGLIKDTSTQPITGVNTPYNRRASLYRNLQFTGETYTPYGTFKIIAGGGVNWYRLSPFTLWSYEYNDDLFERYPWEPQGSPFKRYNSFYATQNIARDSRWAYSGTQGFIIEAKEMPGRFGFSFLYGKADNGTVFQSYRTRTPKNMLAGRVYKWTGNHRLGINYFSQFGADSTTAFFKTNQDIITGDASLNFPHIKIYFEAGVGRYQDSVISGNDYRLVYKQEPSTNRTIEGVNFPFRPCLNLELSSTKELTFIPVSLQAYYIDKSVVNLNGAMLNAANNRALASVSYVNTPNDVTTLQGVLTDIGQMANNRWGVNLRHSDTYGKLKIMVATGISQELENIFDTISFMHRANQFTRSRFSFFQSETGPYRRLVNAYRRTFEKVAITDFGYENQDYKKGYNTIDLSLKYKLRVFNRDLILSNYNTYSSIQDRLKPIPYFNDKAFFRIFYTELMAFLGVTKKVSLVGFVSHERNVGNRWTEQADEKGDQIFGPDNRLAPSLNRRPLNQIGYGYGAGVDVSINERTGLFIRQRWFSHKDLHFIRDRFSGYETSLELKIFF